MKVGFLDSLTRLDTLTFFLFEKKANGADLRNSQLSKVLVHFYRITTHVTVLIVVKVGIVVKAVAVVVVAAVMRQSANWDR